MSKNLRAVCTMISMLGIAAIIAIILIGPVHVVSAEESDNAITATSLTLIDDNGNPWLTAEDGKFILLREDQTKWAEFSNEGPGAWDHSLSLYDSWGERSALIDDTGHIMTWRSIEFRADEGCAIFLDYMPSITNEDGTMITGEGAYIELRNYATGEVTRINAHEIFRYGGDTE